VWATVVVGNEPSCANPSCGIRIHNVAVAACAGEVDMYVPRAGVTTEASTWDAFGPGTDRKVVTVPSVRIDDLNLRVGLMKIDTETTEPAVLRGAPATLRRDRPPIFCEVLGGYTEEALEAILGPLDYRLFRLEPGLQREVEHIVPHERYPNFLFLPS
jgi:FkbM family methyltransferase